MSATAQWRGTPAIKGSSETLRMALLTTSLIGLQFTWNVEMTYCTPYLLELGLTKSKISLVWLAGPLSGLIMQPIAGVIADRSTSRWGRRRPFMFYGTVLVSAFLLLLGWTKEVVTAFSKDPETVRSATVYLAVLSIYGIDFAINAVQGNCRGLIVDTLPVAKQQSGSLWASRMCAVGALAGYAAGAMDLKRFFGSSIGDTQFKQLIVVAVSVLCLAVGITSWAVTERVLVKNGEDDEISSIKQVLGTIAQTAMSLPRGIQAICNIQFWAWIGWFPFYFYSTTWVGEVYLRYDAPAEVRAAGDLTGKVGRVGSMSLIAFSIITFSMSLLLPFIVRSPDDGKTLDFASRSRAVTGKADYKLSLLNAWMIAHCVFASSMIMAPFVQSLRSASIIIAVCGISSSVTGWAPYAFLGSEIDRESSSKEYGHNSQARSSVEIELAADLAFDRRQEETNVTQTGRSSGKYLGIMNLYTTLPQFVSTGISWVVFSILEPGKGPELSVDDPNATDGPNAIAVCFFIGACSSCLATLATRRFQRIQGT